MSDESGEFSDIGRLGSQLDEFFTQMSSKGGSSPSRSPAQVSSAHVLEQSVACT